MFNKIKFQLKKFFTYRKLKKLINPLLNEPTSQLVHSTKEINILYILSYLIDLTLKKSDAVLIVDDDFREILDSIPSLKEHKIYTPREWGYMDMKHVFVLCTPLSSGNFDFIYSKSIIDRDNYYIMVL